VPVVAAATAVGVLWWLNDGDLRGAIEPVLAEWDADTLARDAGLVDRTDATQPTGGSAEAP